MDYRSAVLGSHSERHWIYEKLKINICQQEKKLASASRCFLPLQVSPLREMYTQAFPIFEKLQKNYKRNKIYGS